METAEKLNKQELMAAYDNTVAVLVQQLSSFDEQDFNTVPFEGSWTAGQLGEHLLKSSTAIIQLLRGNTRSAERHAGEKVEDIKQSMLDFAMKSKSAPPVTPSEGPKEKTKLIEDIKAKSGEIGQAVTTEDLSLLCTDFPLPVLGELTRWEWISFLIYHTQRHIHQLKEIRQKIG